MFVPRQVQKKRTPPKQPISTPKFNARPSPLPAPHKGSEVEDSIDIVAARETVMALEIIFSDYSLERFYGNWLNERMRELEGKDDYIHLSTFLDCQYLSRIRPRLSQVSLMKALIECKSDVLELSTDKYHIRRKKAPIKSGNEDRDDHTIYIEPSITSIVLNPGKIARILSEMQLPRKYFPVQFVENVEKSWSFVTLSSAISETDVTNKRLWPENWIILTKSEWQKRDAEYQQLRQNLLRTSTLHHPSLPHKTMPVEISVSQLRDAASPRDHREPPHRNNSSPETGLIVRLTNLHPSTTKTTITSFVCRSVDRYLRKKAKKQIKKNDGVMPGDIRSVKINYVDYEKGLNQAYIRQSDQKDSELIVKTLQKRKRKMRDGGDIKGEKIQKADTSQGWVKGETLVGEEERIYWEKLLLAKSVKGRGKGENGRKNGFIAPVSGIGMKRVRKDGEVSSSNVPKRIKFDQ